MPTSSTPPGADLDELIAAIVAECRSQHTVPRAVVDAVIEKHWPSVGAYDELVAEGAVHLAELQMLDDPPEAPLPRGGRAPRALSLL